MGAIYNKVTLVYDIDVNLKILREKAIELFEPVVKKYYEEIKTDGGFITDTFVTPINGETYFIIHSCGSNAGWEEDNDFINARNEFIKYFEYMGGGQLATLRFGENDRPELWDCLPE